VRIPGSSAAIWIDGRRVPPAEARISIDDPGFAAGFGLFETLALRGDGLLDLDEHLARLERSAERLGLDLGSLPPLRDCLLEALGDSPPACGWVRLSVTAGGRVIIARDRMDPSEEGKASTAVILPWRRNPQDPLCGHKTLNYASNVIGLRFAAERGADEGLWRNTKGRLAEGCTSNLFVVRGRRLFTPSVREGILPGIVRDCVLRAARDLGLHVHEGPLRVPRLRAATEAFLTSSLRGIRPLVAADSRPVGDGRPGPLSARLAVEVGRRRGVSTEP